MRWSEVVKLEGIPEEARYYKEREQKLIARSVYPVAGLVGRRVTVKTPDARYKETLKAAGFRWRSISMQWEKEVTSAAQAVEVMRALVSAIPELLIEERYEKEVLG